MIMIIAGQSSEKIEIDQLWVGEKFLKTKVFLYGKTVQEKDFNKGDTLLLSADDLIMLDKNRNEIINQDSTIQIPFKYIGEGLISYTVNNKRKYVEIKKFESVKPLIYP